MQLVYPELISSHTETLHILTYSQKLPPQFVLLHAWYSKFPMRQYSCITTDHSIQHVNKITLKYWYVPKFLGHKCSQ
jgi:hypothetical protein